MRFLLPACAVFALLLSSCAGPMKAIGTMTLVETSGDKPDWLNEVPEDDGDTMFWVGRKSDSDTEDSALTDAREDCGRQVADYLQNTADKVYEKARVERAATQDLASVRPLIKDAYKAWYKKVKNSGLRQKVIYWERYESVIGQAQVRYLYKAYVLMTVNKEQMLALGREAIAEQIQKAREKNDEMAEEALNGMQDKLEILQR